MDKYFGLIPKEPYGFSNNAIGNIGPPKFEQVKIQTAKRRIGHIDQYR